MFRRTVLAAFTTFALSSGAAPADAQSVADLSVTITANTSYAQVGQAITFTIVATNKGPAPAEVYLQERAPASLAIASIDCGQPTADGTFCEYSWEVARGNSVTMTVVAQVAATTDTVAINAACVTSPDATDPRTKNNCASAPVEIVQT